MGYIELLGGSLRNADYFLDLHFNIFNQSSEWNLRGICSYTIDTFTPRGCCNVSHLKIGNVSFRLPLKGICCFLRSVRCFIPLPRPRLPLHIFFLHSCAWSVWSRNCKLTLVSPVPGTAHFSFKRSLKNEPPTSSNLKFDSQKKERRTLPNIIFNSKRRVCGWFLGLYYRLLPTNHTALELQKCINWYWIWTQHLRYMEHLVSFWIFSPSKKQKKVETSKQVMYRLYVSGAKRTVSPSTLRRRDWKWLNLIESDEFCTLVHWSDIFRYWNYKCSVCSCLLEDPWNQQNSCGCGIHSRLPLLKSPNVWYELLDKP